MKSNVLFFLMLLICSLMPLSGNASSAGDDDSPPPEGGGPAGGGGGGSPQYFDYYVPLIFSESSKYGESQVIIWTYTSSAVITTFSQDGFGRNVVQYQEPTKLIFTPSLNEGLTNGSLIRLTAPAQVVGQRSSQDIVQDISFAYSILPKRMMGFEYFSPFDGRLSLFSLNSGTTVNIQNIDGTNLIQLIPDGSTLTIDVKIGSYINTSYPTLGVFYSNDEGFSASMAVPRYLHGQSYYFSGDITSPRQNEIDMSYLRINPDSPTVIQFQYRTGLSKNVTIFEKSDFILSNDLVGFYSYNSKVEANLRIKFAYGGIIRSSTIQLMAIEEMNSAELFLNPANYSSYYSLYESTTNYNFTTYDYNNDNYISETRGSLSGLKYETISINNLIDPQILLTTKQVFGFSTLPGKSSHPMSPSLAFLNLPLNTQSFQNITGLKSTWYRFPNLAVINTEIIPGPLEEYTGQLIKVEIKANGSLPVSKFKLEITIDDELEIVETFNFLQVNRSLTFEIRKFMELNVESLNITVDVDVDDEVSELNENDNYKQYDFEVYTNTRLRSTIYLVILVLIGVSIKTIRDKYLRKLKLDRSSVDLILEKES